jgi:putative transposase
MNKYNTVFGQMLEVISRSEFEKLVKEYKTEYGAKGLKSWTQFTCMAFAQISGQHGLRSIEQGMNCQHNSWYHLGISNSEKEVKRSSLSYANQRRDADMYKALFETVLGEAQKKKGQHGFKFKNPLYSIDSTTIDLCLKLFPWADFRENKGGLKLTVKLDHRGKIPCFVTESNARQHDSKKIGEVPLKAGDVVAFDRGYTNYDYYATLCKDKVYFVTRLKSNAKYTCIKEREIPEGKNITSDCEISITHGKGALRLRKVTAVDPDTGKEIVLLTNNLGWAASTIAAIYKDRWQIELFFKAVKQNLKIKRFYGNSKNAVMTQIWIALIIYLLFFILKTNARNPGLSFTNFMSLIKTILFQRRCLFDWIQNPSPPYKPPAINVVHFAFVF